MIISEYKWAYEINEEKKDALLKCCECYNMAMKISTSLTKSRAQNCMLSLKKRLGNVKNEIGVYYMNQAQVMQQSTGINMGTKFKCKF